VKLATPAFFGMFVQTLYNVVNTIFIGHFVGPLAIAGLSIVFPLQMLCMGIGMMVGLGGTSLISRYLGAGDIPRAERTLGNGITCSIILSLLLTAIIVPNVNFWLRLIGASEEVLPFAREYLIIIFSGTVFNVAGMALLNYVRGEGNARVGMIANMIGAILNIILDSILIILLHMGVKGAALGTIIAQIVTLIYLSSYYLTGSSYLKIRKSNLPLDFKILKSMFSIGTSSFVQTIGSSISAMFLIFLICRSGSSIMTEPNSKFFSKCVSIVSGSYGGASSLVCGMVWVAKVIRYIRFSAMALSVNSPMSDAISLAAVLR
jgi:putative MATE family efflux protein